MNRAYYYIHFYDNVLVIERDDVEILRRDLNEEDVYCINSLVWEILTVNTPFGVDVCGDITNNITPNGWISQWVDLDDPNPQLTM